MFLGKLIKGENFVLDQMLFWIVFGPMIFIFGRRIESK